MEVFNQIKIHSIRIKEAEDKLKGRTPSREGLEKAAELAKQNLFEFAPNLPIRTYIKMEPAIKEAFVKILNLEDFGFLDNELSELHRLYYRRETINPFIPLLAEAVRILKSPEQSEKNKLKILDFLDYLYSFLKKKQDEVKQMEKAGNRKEKESFSKKISEKILEMFGSEEKKKKIFFYKTGYTIEQVLSFYREGKLDKVAKILNIKQEDFGIYGYALRLISEIENIYGSFNPKN
jgi:hypothetical protein